MWPSRPIFEQISLIMCNENKVKGKPIGTDKWLLYLTVNTDAPKELLSSVALFFINYRLWPWLKHVAGAPCPRTIEIGSAFSYF